MVKARIIRMAASSAGALRAHIAYIKRDSALSPEDKGRVFNAETEDAPTREFTSQASEERHHFRFIVSPEDGAEMAELKPFVRDLMGHVETDFGTRLDWVAAVHEDTAHPHAHIVLRGRRDDGRDLVIPRAYISHGIRDRAEEFVTLELGPETALEAARKLGRETNAERMTRIDRFLIRQAGNDRRVQLKDSPPTYRAVHAARLKTLTRLGLATKAGRGTWQLAERIEPTLKGLGERKDIIKAMNRALAGRTGRRFDADAILDRSDPDGRTVTGAVLAKGVRGEGHDRAYLVLDGLDGRAVYAEIGGAEELEDLKTGMVVNLPPPDVSLKPSDRTIATIASKNDGTYSAGLHQTSDPHASPDFIAAHVRRLESLRRAGLVTRGTDGTWQVPGDYERQVERLHRDKAAKQPLVMKIESRLSIQEQTEAVGVTWLDTKQDDHSGLFGLGAEVAEAAKSRQKFLTQIGVLKAPDQKLTGTQLSELKRRDLQMAGHDLSASMGKAYQPMPARGPIEGTYSRSIDRPSGRFAVIEQGKSFTLAPWRQVLERGRGQLVSGQIMKGRVNWSLTRPRGLGR